MATLPKEFSDIVSISGSIIVQELAQAAFDDVLPEDDWPYFQRIEINAEPCELCAQVEYLIIERGSPDDDAYGDQLHINDEFTKVAVSKNEVDPDGKPVQPDFVAPDPELVAKLGHFVADPDKYSELRSLPSPEGRQFIVHPAVKEEVDESTGEVVRKRYSIIEFRVEPYELKPSRN